MADAKTIDNLGPEVHQDFINRIQLLSEEEVKKLTETPSIAKRAEVLTTAIKPLESDKLFGLETSQTSPFIPPKELVLAIDVLTHSLIPSLGTTAELLQKLKSLNESDLSEEEKDQMKSLSKTITTIDTLTNILQEIQRKKQEYKKG